MASASLLTVIERPEPSHVYLFDEAMADARGNTTHAMRVETDRLYDGTNNTLTLWESGCHSNNGEHNCTAACYDPNLGPQMVWNSTGNMTTLQNCLIYPILTRASENGWLIEKPPGLLKKYNIVVNSTSPKNSSNNEPQEDEWPVINKCMQTMCNLVYKEDGHNCTAWGRYQTNFTIGNETALWSSLVTNAEFCSMGKKSLNADIGGRGVMYSYIQQVSLVLLAWLIVFVTKRTWKACFTTLQTGYEACRRRLGLHSHCSKLDSTAVESSTPPISPKLHTALVTSLYDFQKTQIFFSVTLQITAMITTVDTSWLDATTIPELKIGILMFEIVGSMGIFPLALNLITLSRDKGSLDRFISVASTIAMFLACGPFLTIVVGNWKPGKLKQAGFDPVECGHLNPLQHCIGGVALTNFNGVLARSSGEKWMRLLVVLILLLIGAVLLLFELIPCIWHRSLISGCRQRTWTRLRCISPLIEFVLVCANCSTLSTLYKLTIQIPLAEWSLGQCLAVAIWVPFLVDFAWFLIQGVKHSISVRLARGYRVIEEDTALKASVLPVANDIQLSSAHSIDDRSLDDSSSSYELLNQPRKTIAHANIRSPG